MPLLALLASLVAFAGDFYLEGPSLASRAEAASMLQVATENGYRARVSRRYRHGTGWEYVLLVEGFDAAPAASEAARVLAGHTGRGISVFAIDGRVATPIGSSEPADAPPAAPLDATDDPDPPPPPTGAIDADEVLARSLRAHGGRAGGAPVLAAQDALVLRYRRELPDGRIALHTYARRGDEVFLEIALEAGAGAPRSRTRVLSAGAWLQVGDGPDVAQDAPRAAEVAAQFGPEQLFSFALDYASAVDGRRELRRLHLDGATTVEGRACHVLRYPGDRGSGAMALAVQTDTWLVRQAGFGGGASAVLHQFDDWREVAAGLVLPFKIRTWRQQELVDTVEVLALDLDPRLPEEWLRAPGAP